MKPFPRIITLTLAILLALMYVPFLQPIFGTLSLSAQDWMTILPLILVPSVAAEINKFVLRRLSEREQQERMGA